jgi:hypothetical protein
MNTLNHHINRFKFGQQFFWLVTLLLMIFGWPLFKNALVFILEKLHELFIQ